MAEIALRNIAELAGIPKANLHYIKADGLDIVDSLARAREAIDYCRTQRRPCRAGTGRWFHAPGKRA